VHEHEAGKPERTPRAARSTAAAPEHPLFALQRAAGNAAVSQHVARADVQIEEMTSNVRTTDGAAPMAPGTEEAIENAVHDTAHADDDQKGPSALPPGGHATMEEEA